MGCLYVLIFFFVAFNITNKNINVKNTNYEIKNYTIWMEITLYRWESNKNSMFDKGGSDNSQTFVDFFFKFKHFTYVHVLKPSADKYD